MATGLVAAQAYTDIADGLFGPGETSSLFGTSNSGQARKLLAMPKDEYSAIDVLLATLTSRMRLFALAATTDYDDLKKIADALCSDERESNDAKIRMNAQLTQLLVLAGVKPDANSEPATCPAFTQMQLASVVDRVRDYFNGLKRELPSVYAEALVRLTTLKTDPTETIKRLIDGTDKETRNEVMDVLAQVAQDYAESGQGTERFRPLRSVALRVAQYVALALLLIFAVLLVWRRVRGGRK